MFEIVSSGGVVMIFLLLLMALAMMIVAERFWSLRNQEIIPKKLAPDVLKWSRKKQLDENHIDKLAENSPLGYLMATALKQRHRQRTEIIESVEDAGRHVSHQLEKPLNWLQAIAEVAPLLGLLGTVIGMMKVFANIMEFGVGDANQLAGGISQALTTTAAGLIVAIPAVLFYRYFKNRIADQTIVMEQQVMQLIDNLAPADKP
ncbi:biopolymer transporter ExbB [Marinicella pacifica]|uniref:Biopolymer transporter ExbB n=1 Tax=Marinicella pacifica TaxID=1171543 RepID=A0A917CKW8_9GAMM|nr:MotA/TolQ/ExbB proton channel family protein [Marinicella pacifica]GGF91587.1 biopolymer transporter ExbB [Marinicella pacifica]